MILPSVGAQTGNRLAQMIGSDAQSQRYAAQGLRQQAFQQQRAAGEERERKQMLLMALLQQHAQKRQTKRAARGPSYMSRLGENLIGDTPFGAFIETKHWGQKPIPESRSIMGFIQRWMAMKSGQQGLQQQQQQGLQRQQQLGSYMGEDIASIPANGWR